MAFFNSINQVGQIAWGLGSQTWNLVTSRKALSFGCFALLAGAGARWAMEPKNDLAGRMCAIPSMQLELINAPFEEQVLDLSVRACEDFSEEQPSRASVKSLEFSSLFVSKYLKDKDPDIQGLAQRGKQACDAAIGEYVIKLSKDSAQLLQFLETTEFYEATVPANITQPLKDRLSVFSEVYFGSPYQAQVILGEIGKKELRKEEIKDLAQDKLYCEEFFNLKESEKYDEAQQELLDEKLVNLELPKLRSDTPFLEDWRNTCAITSIIYDKYGAIERYEQSEKSCLESEHCISILPTTPMKCGMFAGYSHVQRGIQRIQNFCIKNGFTHPVFMNDVISKVIEDKIIIIRCFDVVLWPKLKWLVGSCIVGVPCSYLILRKILPPSILFLVQHAVAAAAAAAIPMLPPAAVPPVLPPAAVTSP